MTVEDIQLQNEIIQLTGSMIEPASSLDALRAKLAVHINDLIVNDFEGLIGLLYRLDVSEQKLKQLLQTHSNVDAGNIMADAIIKRQKEKIQSRKKFSKWDHDIPEDEKW